MAHPFFDESEYPWYRPEAGRLHKVLWKAVKKPAEIELLYQQCGEDLPPLALGFSPKIIWKEALENLAAHGALRKLCDLGMEQLQSEQIQNTIRDVLNTRATAAVLPVQDDVIVLDRTELRQQLALLEPADTPVKVLVVRGDPRTGKSHGRHLFERAASASGARPVYMCDGMVATANDVVTLLFSTLQASSLIPDPDTSDEAWYRKVCYRLLEVTASKGRPLWIAIDDLGPAADGGSLLDPEIRKFCDQFALNMVNSDFRKWFRLMLIHYPDGAVPTRWKREFWREDRTSEEDVTREHVVDELREWSARRNLNMVEDELIKLAADVIAKAEVPAASGQEELPRLQRIHDVLADTLRDLARRSA